MALTLIFGGLLVIAVWEFSWPRRQREFPAMRRRLGNVGFWMANLFIGLFFSPPDSEVRMTLYAAWGIDIPYWPIADDGLSFVAAFLILDLIYYAVHRCEHAVPLFWRFHALHHSDPDVDVTTSVRHHPVEYLLTSAVYWLAALFLDIPVEVVLGHALAVFGTAAVQHGNIRLPERLERWLQPVLVTVDMHRVHHSIEFSRENWNYGAVLSIWDRLFRTYTRLTRVQHDSIVFGVSELPRRDGLKPSAMLLTPWRLGRAGVQEAA